MTILTELRLRTQLRPEDLTPKTGKVVGRADYDLLLTGAARVNKPDGRPLCVYLPGALLVHTQNADIYDVLHSLRTQTTTNRIAASGTIGVKYGTTGQADARPTPSAIIGTLDPTAHQKYCRLTAWTGKNLPGWTTLTPLLVAMAQEFARHVPDRYAAQTGYTTRTHPAWLVPGTPFTTVTVNNTYATGMHKDSGDLEEGFSTLACLRRGTYYGGYLTFPEYRVAVDMQDGDLLLMDAHEWHANTALICACANRLFGMCDTCQAERISVVAYYRKKMIDCGTVEEEAHRAERSRAK